MQTSIIGYPRIGSSRELKFQSEAHFRGEVSIEELDATAAALRAANRKDQQAAGLNWIPVNDFSYYDAMLDTATMLHAVPRRYLDLNLPLRDTYFAMARGYQGPQGDVKALAMKKWFHTNYHYMVPELDDDMDLYLWDTKVLDLWAEANNAGVNGKVTLIGPYTFLKLAKYTGHKGAGQFVHDITKVYAQVLEKLSDADAEWVAFEEPCLVKDMSVDDIGLFKAVYNVLLPQKKDCKILLQTYFGDIRDVYGIVSAMNFDGIGLDFIEGDMSMELLEKYGFPSNKTLFAGVINGKNIWRSDYSKVIPCIRKLEQYAPKLVIQPSSSLMLVPYTVENEHKLEDKYLRHFAFAKEKLNELQELRMLADQPSYETNPVYVANRALFTEDRGVTDPDVQARLQSLTEDDFVRQPDFYTREKIQKKALHLPKLPTTTIGSFPQTKDVRATRAAYRKGEITKDAYESFMKEKIAACVKEQEDLGLDVLVHGEFERNDMVEYFGENLKGFLFTENAWVQSYGTRCVKPPIIWGDVSREKPMTVQWITYAQSLTDKPLKGMLTGPVTILNWSFPREDISRRESTLQIALAIRDEVLDLEAAGIRIIQIDEAALREKLPLRKSRWYEDYLDWAIPAFRLVHSGVKPETQIHTHMCYSEFGDMLSAIDDMDADVITFEASRSDLSLLDDLAVAGFRTEVGPGVYDIHSPRVPSQEEITDALHKMLERIPAEKLWVNPDCGLKTRGEKEVKASLTNMVAAAKEVRESL